MNWQLLLQDFFILGSFSCFVIVLHPKWRHAFAFWKRNREHNRRCAVRWKEGQPYWGKGYQAGEEVPVCGDCYGRISYFHFSQNLNEGSLKEIGE